MKISTSLLFSLIAIAHLFGQAPEKFSFQSVIRNSANQLVSNQQIGVKISILQGNISGSIIYSETHTSFSNSQGLVSLQIGTGSIISGNFNLINWSNGIYYLKTEIDI